MTELGQQGQVGTTAAGCHKARLLLGGKMKEARRGHLTGLQAF
jgi:hypothetical protein